MCTTLPYYTTLPWCTRYYPVLYTTLGTPSLYTALGTPGSLWDTSEQPGRPPGHLWDTSGQPGPERLLINLESSKGDKKCAKLIKVVILDVPARYRATVHRVQE